jgi:hypothetical protein
MAITLDGTTGITTPGLTNTGTETIVNLTTTGNTILGDASTDTLNVGNGGLIKDASGNLGVGVTPFTNTISKSLDMVNGVGLFGYNGASYLSSNAYFDTSWKYKASGFGGARYSQDAGTHAWSTAPSGTAGNAITFTQAMTLDASGNLLVGTTSAGDGKVRISASANAYNILKIDDTGTTTGNYVQFLNSAGSQAGAINHSGTTSVSYNSGSDYRLKNITGPVTNAIAFINSLKPKVGTWKEDGSKFVGFLAHEFAEVCPQAVQGEKDGVDADGKPLYQSMEASSPEVIANIVSLLQEQQALITSLTARLEVLEAK